jgi:predicted transcriptional regulator
MTTYKIQSLSDLEAEMRAVARGERPAPADAAKPSFASAAALMRLLTPENRELLRLVRDVKPESIAALSRLTGRKEPNLLRTLEKLAAAGLVELREVDRRRVPRTRIRKLRLDIDPFGTNDRVEVA